MTGHRARGGAPSTSPGRRLRVALAAAGLGIFSTIGLAVMTAPLAGATTTATLYVDNVHGTKTTGCTSSGAGACKTIQEGIDAATVLSNTAATLYVAGSSTTYDETDRIQIPSGTTSLDIVGTGVTPPTLNDHGTATDLNLTTSNAGPVTISNFTISDGYSVNWGGGIRNGGTGSLTVENVTFTSNAAVVEGGAIDASDGCITGGHNNDLTVIDSTFTDNGVDAPDGGAIDFGDCSDTGNAVIDGNTFVNNTGYGQIDMWDGGTFDNNTIESTSVNITRGALIVDGISHITDNTFSGSVGPAIFGYTAYRPLTANVADSILDDIGGDCGGTAITDNGYNVVSDTSCALGGLSLHTSVSSINLQALASNGSAGPQTEAITTSSAAYHEVPKEACTVSTDERGQFRPGIGTSCDAGSYEIEPPAGYDLVGSDGGVFVFPKGGGFYGSLPGLGVHVSDVVGIVPTLGFHGYDLVGADGGVFVFPLHQSSGFYGSLPGIGVHVSNIVGIVPNATDTGYFLVGSDGGVFAFHTTFAGSLPGIGDRVNDVVGIAATADDKGYWVVEADGVVHAFGDAISFGDAPFRSSPAVSIAATPNSGGYWVAYADGTVVGDGNAVVYGSAPAPLTASIVSLAPTTDGKGYWLVGRDGNLYDRGDAASDGSLPALHVTVNNIVGAVPTG